jgi:glutathione S-transferase
MALFSAGIQVEITEVALKEKPPEMLALSPKGTVPVLQLEDGQVLDESLGIMDWALRQNDPDNWLPESISDDAQGLCFDLITENDSTFKDALDRYKYPQRYPDEDCSKARDGGMAFLSKLNALLSKQPYLLGEAITYADIATFPFIRQFANTDLDWFNSSSLTSLQSWLDNLVNSVLFKTIMKKHLTRLLD